MDGVKRDMARTEWGDFAKFWNGQEWYSGCQYVTHRQVWRDIAGNEVKSWWGSRKFPDMFVDQPGIWGDERLRVETTLRRGRCNKRSCEVCQRKRHGKWSDRILNRTDHEPDKLHFVTATLEGFSDGRKEWNENLTTAYDHLNTVWKKFRQRHRQGVRRGLPWTTSTNTMCRVFEVPRSGSSVDSVDTTGWNPHVHCLVASPRAEKTVYNHWRTAWQWTNESGSTVKPRIQVKEVRDSDELVEYITKVTRYMTKQESATKDSVEIDNVMYRRRNIAFTGEWYGNGSRGNSDPN